MASQATYPSADIRKGMLHFKARRFDGPFAWRPMQLDHLDFSNADLARLQERQRLANVLSVCQCLLLAAVLVVLLWRH